MGVSAPVPAPAQASPTLASSGTPYRPERLVDLVGHGPIRRALWTLCAAARAKRAALPGILLSGPPGLGKTSMALALSKELSVPFMRLQSDGVTAESLRTLLTEKMAPGTILFLDEIHRLSAHASEAMYGAMEDGRITIDGQPTEVPPFTTVGATTLPGRMPPPLRRRFRHHFTLTFLEPEDLAKVAWNAAAACGVALDTPACLEVARRSKGTPRQAVHVLGWLGDAAGVEGRSAAAGATLTMEDVDRLCLDIGVGPDGLDELDRRYLQALRDQYGGGPVGLKALAATLNEDQATLACEVEPWLLHARIVSLGPRGRTLSGGDMGNTED